jgi:hypothetical protein
MSHARIRPSGWVKFASKGVNFFSPDQNEDTTDNYFIGHEFHPPAAPECS